MKRLFAMIALVGLISCGDGGHVEGGQAEKMEYARNLSIIHHDEYICVEITNPWDSTKLLNRYALVSRDSEIKSVAGATVVRVPIERAVIYNSVHASIVEMLGATESIVGACELRYMDSDMVRERIDEGLIADVGEATAPNIERIIDIATEAILSSPFKDMGYGAVEKLRIPIVEGADYMEPHPLGRVEWIKFYGMLFGQRERADSIFSASSGKYNDLKRLAATAQNHPTVMVERRYGSNWFIPGADSYHATMFADAGADYIFSHIKSSGSVPLSFETILDIAINADYWILKYNYPHSDMSYDDLKAEYEPYANFGSFKRRQIYGCNTAHRRYYEDIPMAPHLLLAEYVAIFHPELMADFEPHYFAPLEER